LAGLILKEHGAHAVGKVSHSKDGKWSATFLVTDPDKGFEQRMGPEFFTSEHEAKGWILLQAGHRGFEDGDFDIHIERLPDALPERP
jgi:hypothetical protein